MALRIVLLALALTCSTAHAAWTKKSGTIPDKIKTLLVVDTSDGNRIKDLGTSLCSEDTNMGTVTFDGTANTFTATGLVTGNRVYFFGGTLPTSLSPIGISADVTSNMYYVVNSNQLSATSGGSAIDFTGNGTPTTTIYKANGITLTSDDGPVTLTRTDRTSDAWGTGVLLSAAGGNNPHRLMFTSIGNGLPPIMNRTSGQGYSQLVLANRITSIADRSLWVADTTNIPAIGYETAAPVGFAMKDDVNSDQVVGTTDLVAGVPIAIGATGKRHATEAEHRIYYAAPTTAGNHTVTGSFALEAGPTQIDGIGNDAGLRSVHWRGTTDFVWEMFMIVLADQAILTSTEFNTIMNDPLGTLVDQGAAPAATLSSPTPSGTLGTTTTATVGATTDTTSGTFYAVVDSGANLSGVTAAQIKAGQKASGAAALAANSGMVSTTTPSVGVTGLSANTAYAYSAIQNSAGGDSNIVSGTFTTAMAASAVPIFTHHLEQQTVQ